MRHIQILAILAITLGVAGGSNGFAEPTENSFAGQTRSKDYNAVVNAYRSGQSTKIVGGKVAPDNSYPWQVSLEVSWIADPAAAHFCGGSIYSDTWIITAAHCLTGLQADDLVVAVGINKLAPGIRRMNVSKLIVHPNYFEKTHDNDIALLKLKGRLVFSDAIKAVQLGTSADEDGAASGQAALTVTGWGATEEGGETVSLLRYVDVSYVDRGTCTQPLSYNGQITDNMICAGQVGKDSCQGDSGGPLISKSPSQSRLLGIVSWGDGCARALKFGVYTRVPAFAKWISSNTD